MWCYLGHLNLMLVKVRPNTEADQIQASQPPLMLAVSYLSTFSELSATAALQTGLRMAKFTNQCVRQTNYMENLTCSDQRKCMNALLNKLHTIYTTAPGKVSQVDSWSCSFLAIDSSQAT